MSPDPAWRSKPVRRRTASLPLAHLVAAARSGSADALGALYERYGAGLYRLAYRLLGNREDAEDVVHDLFVGLPEALRRYEERGALESWLKRVTARVALMRLRAGGRRREVHLAVARELVGGDSSAAPPDSRLLQAAVDRLPEHLRSVLVLKEIEGYSHAEVSELLGISQGASRIRLMRAVRRLRKSLEDAR